jgi:hypothetical protein
MNTSPRNGRRPWAAIELRQLPLLLLLIATAGCAGGVLQTAPPAVGWSREAFRITSESCWADNCRSRMKAAQGNLEITTRARSYAPHQIAGWERPLAERLALSTAMLAVRWAGGTTEQTRIGLGTRVVSAGPAAEWQLRCSIFWMDTEEKHSRRSGEETSYVQRQAQGARCGAVATADTSIVRWRFTGGIAPPRDSLAALVDSLMAAGSPLLNPFPPMSLERLTAAGEVAERYVIENEFATLAHFVVRVRLHVARETGAALATFHGGDSALLDVAPEATAEEAAVLRLIAAAVAMWLRPTAR